MYRHEKIGLIFAGVVTAGLFCSFTATADEVQDATTMAKIETAFLFNEHLNPFELKTTARDGTITLNGTVQTQVQKDLAEGIAKSVIGVKQVVNNITVASAPLPESRADEWSSLVNDATVTASVITRISGVKNVDPSNVRVNTQGGVVTLSGEVASPEQRERLESIARSTRGVVNVRDNLDVKKPATPVQAQAGRVSMREEAVPGGQGVKTQEPEGLQRNTETAARVKEEVEERREERREERQPARTGEGEYGVREEPMRGERSVERGSSAIRRERTEEERRANTEAEREQKREHAEAKVDPEAAERAYRERSSEAQRLRREADERRQEARQDIQERQREYREEYGTVDDPERLSAARRDLRQDIAEIRDEAETDAAKLEQRAQRIEREARQEYADARRGTEPETDRVGERVSEVTSEVREKAERVGATVSDEWLEKRIELDLALNRNVNMGNLDVEVNDGVATLNGTVTSDTERRLAQQIADSINGIRQVKNNIRVEPNPQG